jgi:hypothetical protein
MAEEAKYTRISITVPPDLKRRMEVVEEEVNWSGVACRAFEAKLAEMASKKERKTMDDVISRLRASKQQEEDADYRGGEARGRKWAETRAEAYELMRLEDFRERHGGWDRLLSYESSQSPASRLAYWISPEHEALNSGRAEEFWQSVLGPGMPMPESDSFVRGFAEGALSLWLEVQDRV